MSRANRFHRGESVDSLLRFPIQRRTARIQSTTEEDSSTTIEEISWSTMSRTSLAPRRRHYSEKQAPLVPSGSSTEEGSDSATESSGYTEDTSAATATNSLPMTLSTLSGTSETSKADFRTMSSAGEQFSTLSSYDDSSLSDVTATSTSEASSNASVFPTTTSDCSLISTTSAPVEKNRLAAGKDFSFSDASSSTSTGDTSDSTSSACLQSIYYADQITLCLNGRCRVFAFDRVNCRCNDSDWSREENSTSSRSSSGRRASSSSRHAKPLKQASCRPQVEPPVLSSHHKWRYAGVLTHEEAEKVVRNRTEFRLYHQFVPEMDYSGVERLPLVVIYQSSKWRLYHWRVQSVGHFVEEGDKTVYQIEFYYIENGGPTCRTLNDLLDIYADHAYNIDGQIENFFVFE